MQVLFCTIVISLVYGGLVYLLTRALCYSRKYRHARQHSMEVDELVGEPDTALLTILVPSYKEEPRVALRTLLSAALQTYSRRRIALLIDDPPFAANPADRAALEETRKLPETVAALLREPRSWIEACTRNPRGQRAPSADQVTALLRRVAQWFEGLAAQFDRSNHEEQLFAERIALPYAENCRDRSRHIEAACRHGEEFSVAPLVEAACRFLEGVFAAELHAFERKQFANLSHEPNKAMNLNSYIGLIGKSFAIERRGHLRFLVPAPAQAAAAISG